MLSTDHIKQLVGEAGAELVQQDMILGIGSGSTVLYFIQALGKKVRNGLRCQGVPTSDQTRALATEQGISIIELDDLPSIDLTIDGADEIDSSLRLIKGGGGYLLQEKMVAANSKKFVTIADHTKLRDQLGKFPLPVEVIPYGWQQVKRKIFLSYNIQINLRQKNDQPYLTDHGHYILDCYFGAIEDPGALNISLHLIPGVVETGLFIDMCEQAIIGYADGNIKTINR